MRWNFGEILSCYRKYSTKWYFHDILASCVTYETEALPIPQIKYRFLTYSRRRQSNTTSHSLVSTGGTVVCRVEFIIPYSTQTASFAVEKFHRKDTICPLLCTKIRYAIHTPHTKLPYPPPTMTVPPR